MSAVHDMLSAGGLCYKESAVTQRLGRKVNRQSEVVTVAADDDLGITISDST